MSNEINIQKIFDNTVSDYILLSNGGCVSKKENIPDNVARALEFAAESFETVDCTAQFAIFCIFNNFNSIEEINRYMWDGATSPPLPKCEMAINGVINMLKDQQNRRLIPLLDDEHFKLLKSGVKETLNFDKQLSDLKLKLEQEQKKKTHIISCKSENCKNEMISRENFIKTHTTCQKKGGAKLKRVKKATKRRVKKTRRSRNHRK